MLLGALTGFELAVDMTPLVFKETEREIVFFLNIILYPRYRIRIKDKDKFGELCLLSA
jgi:hypothetical protein